MAEPVPHGTCKMLLTRPNCATDFDATQRNSVVCERGRVLNRPQDGESSRRLLPGVRSCATPHRSEFSQILWWNTHDVAITRILHF
jgi:hypothetical protein